MTTRQGGFVHFFKVTLLPLASCPTAGTEDVNCRMDRTGDAGSSPPSPIMLFAASKGPHRWRPTGHGRHCLSEHSSFKHQLELSLQGVATTCVAHRRRHSRTVAPGWSQLCILNMRVGGMGRRGRLSMGLW